jgi:hypothetical protein
MRKSFLLLFFKKEGLPSAAAASKKESSSFLEKRTKKLLRVGCLRGAAGWAYAGPGQQGLHDAPTPDSDRGVVHAGRRRGAIGVRRQFQ